MKERPYGAESQLYLREEAVRASFEAFLLAWRKLSADCDAHMMQLDIGSAHYRILFLVKSHPDLTPGRLQAMLGITKQSLGRALSDLKERNLVEQFYDRRDRRKRPLRLTPAGETLERELFSLIRDHLTIAYKQVDGAAVDGFRRVLKELSPPAE
ncbi:MarR family transcriptional regulator [Acetobacteraceae bacterium ESL0709]|nr:MarR family transcriptional regulator [Acetobacteraceae bacterium ESL0697]MDF7678351.1 MarR family transcriptional regulator [Acetobacteraceae bacterium ESL0709]